MRSLTLLVITTTFGQWVYGQAAIKAPKDQTEVTGSDNTEWATKVWFLHVGPGAILFAPQTQVSVNGARIPGSETNIGANGAFGVETGLLFTPSIGASLAVGIPPRASVSASGSIAPLGFIGSTKYGPAIATVHYHLARWRVFQPYIGGGVNYTIMLAKRDGSVSDLALTNGFGPVLQVGGDIRVSRHWGVFTDLKKLFVATNVTGNVPAFGGAPAQAHLSLDPWLIQTGVSYRFGAGFR